MEGREIGSGLLDEFAEWVNGSDGQAEVKAPRERTK
jgi:hypothetical protein